MLSLTTQQIAELAGGELRGDGNVRITGVGSLETAGPSDLAFVAKKKLLPAAAACKAGAILTAEPVDGYQGAQIICEDVELTVARLLGRLRHARFARPQGVSEAARIARTASIGRGVAVGPYAVIDEETVVEDNVVVHALSYVGRGCRIGEGTVIYPHATVCDGVTIGRNCILHPGCVVGGEGFGFIQRDGRSIRLPHVAGVRIGDDVEVGPNACVDRGMLEDTVIGNGVKMDNFCNVAHNCRIGDHTIMAGFTRIAGSTVIGKGVVMGADSRVVDHKKIGDGATLGAGTSVMADVEAGAIMLGTPARPARETLRIMAMEGKLPEMHRRLMALEKQVEELKASLERASQDQ
jgi:UDP-3-O-[3-hydroxymyristoyl] glucosamine N-acyltransferase